MFVVSEQQNIIPNDTYRVPQGTILSGNEQIDLHKGDPRLFSHEAVTAARQAVSAVVEKPLSVASAESMRINNALAVGQWMEHFRAEVLRKAS